MARGNPTRRLAYASSCEYASAPVTHVTASRSGFRAACCSNLAAMPRARAPRSNGRNPDGSFNCLSLQVAGGQRTPDPHNIVTPTPLADAPITPDRKIIGIRCDVGSSDRSPWPEYIPFRNCRKYLQFQCGACDRHLLTFCFYRIFPIGTLLAQFALIIGCTSTARQGPPCRALCPARKKDRTS